MNYMNSKTEWAKFGTIKQLAFIGKEVVCIGSGCHMMFINVVTKAESLYHANGSSDLGEGISAIAGHRLLPFFSFSEKCRFPKAYVKAYPSFEIVCVLDKKTNEDYITMAFSEGEFLITLSDTPAFEIIIWNWRNGQRIASMESEIVGRKQMIRCNLTTPIYFAQIEYNKKRLHMWEIAICGNKCVLTPRKILPHPDSGNFSDILWTSEGTLFLLDTFGNVYALIDYNLTRVITWESECEGSNTPSFAWYKAGIIISGPDGVINHYKKIGEWTCDWSATTFIFMKTIKSNYRDLLIGNSIDGEILLYNQIENNFNYIKQYESHFDNMCMIYPVGEYFVTLQHNREVTSWEIATGEKKDMKVLRGKALAIKENPEYPYVGVSYDHGVLELLSIFDPSAITTMTYFNLSKYSLNSVYFTEIGKLIVCANTDLGHFFIIEGIPGSTMNIIATFEAEQQICDYMLVASRTCMRLFVIYVTSDLYLCGNKIARYCIIRDKPGVEVKVYQLQSSAQMYSKIYVTTKPNRDRVFFAIPLTTKCINELTTKRGDPFARLTNAFHTEHQMKKILLHTDKHHAITYAYDGLVIIRSPDLETNFGIIMPHYRTDGGVVKAYVDPLRKYVVSLGRDNTLVCTSLTDTKINIQKQEQLSELLNNPRLILMFTRPTIGFTPKGELAKKTWSEYVYLETTKREELACRIERDNILAEFKSIKTELSRLLTANIEGPDNEKLDLQEFNLDVDLKEELIKQSQDDCQRTKIYLESLIIAQDKVTQWLKTFCWDSMSIIGQSICGIFANFQVDNYVLLPFEQNMEQNSQLVDEYRKLEIQLATDDTFQPWIPKTTSELNLQLSEIPKITEIEQGPNILDLMEEEEEMEEEQTDLDQITAFNGSVSHLFIELGEYHYTQEQIQSFLQTKFETLSCMIESNKLRFFLNKKFGETMTTKEREMGMVLERNARLRHILSELNYFSETKIDIYVEDPVWTATEQPETILVVDNKEVGITPYISPSDQAILDAIAAEEERIRLLLLADDFRERALMVMMNGVLEVRWEDELRKDVPIPKFMLEKSPETFNEEEIRAEMAYQEEVKFLNSERERYKKMLEAEYGRVSNIVRDGVKKFNNRLSDFLLLKIQVDSGLRQEHLKLCRWQLKNLKTKKMNTKETEILRMLEIIIREIEAIHLLITSLNETLYELRIYNETFAAKEKLLDKAFKKDFQDATPVVQEQSVRLCKRRPKITMRNVNSIVLTLEVAKTVVTQEKSIILTPDCFEFLKSLDTLDQYVNVPASVDEVTYALVCKHRRFKIENELKAKATSMEIAEAVETISTFNKLLHQKKEREQKLFVELDQVRNDKLNHFHDIEMQLVLRGGIVEIFRSGKISDFDDTVVINRKDVEVINKIVLKGGRRKIKAMKATMSFRRGILIMEWQHRRLKMQIEDLESYLVDIDSINLTKDLQSYLKFKARGQSPEKVISFEEETELIKMAYQKIIDDEKSKVKKLQNKIDILEKENGELDKESGKLDLAIASVNVDVCEYQLERDFGLEEKEKNIIKLRMKILLKRSRLISKIQKNHSDILLLQTELEIMRLKTFPTLSYKILQ